MQTRAGTVPDGLATGVHTALGLAWLGLLEMHNYTEQLNTSATVGPSRHAIIRTRIAIACTLTAIACTLTAITTALPASIRSLTSRPVDRLAAQGVGLHWLSPFFMFDGCRAAAAACRSRSVDATPRPLRKAPF